MINKSYRAGAMAVIVCLMIVALAPLASAHDTGAKPAKKSAKVESRCSVGKAKLEAKKSRAMSELKAKYERKLSDPEYADRKAELEAKYAAKKQAVDRSFAFQKSKLDRKCFKKDKSYSKKSK